MVHLAVYGTLRKGMSNHHLLEDAKCLYKGYSQIPYQMYQAGGIPYLVPSEEEHRIFLEVYEVGSQTVREINRLERGYEKTVVYIDEIPEDHVDDAWIYIMREGFGGEKVEDGEFTTKAEIENKTPKR